MDSTLIQIRKGWSGELGVPLDVFEAPGAHTFATEADSVVVISLYDSQVTVGSPAAIERVAEIEPSKRDDMNVLLAALIDLGPEPIGSANLSYVERVRAPVGVEVAVGPVQNVDMLREKCTPEEWQESGLIDMPVRVAARRTDGKVAAIAGYERWGRHLAQLGVLADPAWRGHGYAAAAAARAAQAAQNEALVPQWRSRIGSKASDELAIRLGFQLVGKQVAILLAA